MGCVFSVNDEAKLGRRDRHAFLSGRAKPGKESSDTSSQVRPARVTKFEPFRATVEANAANTAEVNAANPVDALLRGGEGDLAVLGEEELRAALSGAAQPVLVLAVPAQAPAQSHPSHNLDPAPEGEQRAHAAQLDALLLSTASASGGQRLWHGGSRRGRDGGPATGFPEDAEEDGEGGLRGQRTFLLMEGRGTCVGREDDGGNGDEDSGGGCSGQSLVLWTSAGATRLRCVLANAAALRALGLQDEEAVLGFLASRFNADRGLVSLFQDTVKRLLSGCLAPAQHFVPGDFGRDRYFLSMRVSPFALRTAKPNGVDGGGDGGGGVMPALLLELDVPYEERELAARLQRDYMIMSNIPSAVTIFDMRGNVLHQNRASVAYLGYRVGGGLQARARAREAQAGAGRPDAGAAALQLQAYGNVDGVGADEGEGAAPALSALFALHPEKLAEVMLAVVEGKEWRGLVRMAPSLAPQLDLGLDSRELELGPGVGPGAGAGAGGQAAALRIDSRQTPNSLPLPHMPPGSRGTQADALHSLPGGAASSSSSQPLPRSRQPQYRSEGSLAPGGPLAPPRRGPGANTEAGGGVAEPPGSGLLSNNAAGPVPRGDPAACPPDAPPPGSACRPHSSSSVVAALRATLAAAHVARLSRSRSLRAARDSRAEPPPPQSADGAVRARGVGGGSSGPSSGSSADGAAAEAAQAGGEESTAPQVPDSPPLTAPPSVRSSPPPTLSRQRLLADGPGAAAAAAPAAEVVSAHQHSGGGPLGSVLPRGPGPVSAPSAGRTPFRRRLTDVGEEGEEGGDSDDGDGNGADRQVAQASLRASAQRARAPGNTVSVSVSGHSAAATAGGSPPVSRDWAPENPLMFAAAIAATTAAAAIASHGGSDSSSSSRSQRQMPWLRGQQAHPHQRLQPQREQQRRAASAGAAGGGAPAMPTSGPAARLRLASPLSGGGAGSPGGVGAHNFLCSAGYGSGAFGSQLLPCSSGAGPASRRSRDARSVEGEEELLASVSAAMTAAGASVGGMSTFAELTPPDVEVDAGRLAGASLMLATSTSTEAFTIELFTRSMGGGSTSRHPDSQLRLAAAATGTATVTGTSTVPSEQVLNTASGSASATPSGVVSDAAGHALPSPSPSPNSGLGLGLGPARGSVFSRSLSRSRTPGLASQLEEEDSEPDAAAAGSAGRAAVAGVEGERGKEKVRAEDREGGKQLAGGEAQEGTPGGRRLRSDTPPAASPPCGAGSDSSEEYIAGPGAPDTATTTATDLEADAEVTAGGDVRAAAAVTRGAAPSRVASGSSGYGGFGGAASAAVVISGATPSSPTSGAAGAGGDASCQSESALALGSITLHLRRLDPAAASAASAAQPGATLAAQLDSPGPASGTDVTDFGRGVLQRSVSKLSAVEEAWQEEFPGVLLPSPSRAPSRVSSREPSLEPSRHASRVQEHPFSATAAAPARCAAASRRGSSDSSGSEGEEGGAGLGLQLEQVFGPAVAGEAVAAAGVEGSYGAATGMLPVPPDLRVPSRPQLSWSPAGELQDGQPAGVGSGFTGFSSDTPLGSAGCSGRVSDLPSPRPPAAPQPSLARSASPVQQPLSGLPAAAHSRHASVCAEGGPAVAAAPNSGVQPQPQPPLPTSRPRYTPVQGAVRAPGQSDSGSGNVGDMLSRGGLIVVGSVGGTSGGLGAVLPARGSLDVSGSMAPAGASAGPPSNSGEGVWWSKGSAGAAAAAASGSVAVLVAGLYGQAAAVPHSPEAAASAASADAATAPARPRPPTAPVACRSALLQRRPGTTRFWLPMQLQGAGGLSLAERAGAARPTSGNPAVSAAAYMLGGGLATASDAVPGSAEWPSDVIGSGVGMSGPSFGGERYPFLDGPAYPAQGWYQPRPESTLPPPAARAIATLAASTVWRPSLERSVSSDVAAPRRPLAAARAPAFASSSSNVNVDAEGPLQCSAPPAYAAMPPLPLHGRAAAGEPLPLLHSGSPASTTRLPAQRPGGRSQSVTVLLGSGYSPREPDPRTRLRLLLRSLLSNAPDAGGGGGGEANGGRVAGRVSSYGSARLPRATVGGVTGAGLPAGGCGGPAGYLRGASGGLPLRRRSSAALITASMQVWGPSLADIPPCPEPPSSAGAGNASAAHVSADALLSGAADVEPSASAAAHTPAHASPRTRAAPAAPGPTSAATAPGSSRLPQRAWSGGTGVTRALSGGVGDAAVAPLGPVGLPDNSCGVPGGVRWHEVAVKPVVDPMSGERVLLLVATDVSKQVAAEEVLAGVLEAEHCLLADVFPQHVVAAMTAARNASAEAARRGLTLLRNIQDPAALATSHECITVLFADIKGFTAMCKEVAPAAVMTFLNDLYTRLDSLTDVYGVYKVETIGDCYMVAGGLMARGADGIGAAVRRGGGADPRAAQRVVSFARAMLAEAAAVRLPNTGEPVQMRIGIHSGPATSGVVGAKMPRFCLFGDTINTASRMESTGRPGSIHVSGATRALLPAEEDELGWMATGGVEVKGKGRMETFMWAPHSAAASRQRAAQRRTAMVLGTLSGGAAAAAAAAAAATAAVAEATAMPSSAPGFVDRTCSWQAGGSGGGAPGEVGRRDGAGGRSCATLSPPVRQASAAAAGSGPIPGSSAQGAAEPPTAAKGGPADGADAAVDGDVASQSAPPQNLSRLCPLDYVLRGSALQQPQQPQPQGERAAQVLDGRGAGRSAGRPLDRQARSAGACVRDAFGLHALGYNSS